MVVDNDIFMRTVSGPWRLAAAAVFGSDLTERATERTLQAVADVLRGQDGCPGLSELVTIASSLHSGQRPATIVVLEMVDDVERRHMNMATRIAGDVIRRWCVVEDPLLAPHEVALTFVSEFIVDLSLRFVSPARMLMDLQRSGEWSSEGLEERRTEFRTQLHSAERLTKLAAQLLDDPSGVKVTRPRFRRMQADQQELLETFALTV